MNEIIKVEINENNEQVVSGRELHKLIQSKDFKSLFLKVSKIKVKSNIIELRQLIRELEKPIYYFKFGNEAMVYLKDTIETELLIPCKNFLKEIKYYSLEEIGIKGSNFYEFN